MSTTKVNLKMLKIGMILTCFTLVLSSCGGVPPRDEVTRADYIIKEARENGANEYAPLELRNAVQTLNKAKAAMDDDEYEDAYNLAKTAEVEAELAKAKTESAKAQKAANEIQDSIETLKKELSRENLKIQ